MSAVTSAIASELIPPAEPSIKQSAKDRSKKRGPARPYRKLNEEVLSARILRLTTRIERVKRQHESTRILLTKYAHERFYRDKEALEAADSSQPPIEIPPLNG
jgi:hypothetical protein